MDNQLALLTLCGSVIALLFAFTRAKKVLTFPQGTDRMAKISASIHNGAMAYLRRQYKILIGFFAVMFVILAAMAAFDMLTWFVPVSYTHLDVYKRQGMSWNCTGPSSITGGIVPGM